MVEWKKLGEIASIMRGRSLSKNDLGEGTTPVILYGELYTIYGDYIIDIVSKTTLEKAQTATKLYYEDIVLPVSSTTKEAQIGKVSVIKADTDVFLGSDAVILRGFPNASYLMYYLNSAPFEKKKMRCVKGTTIMHLDPQKLANQLIPIPTLSEQQRIVETLDTFTASIENIKEQIAQRRKQYEYYREKLLNLEGKDEVEVKTLGEIGVFIKGSGILKSDFEESDYGCIHYGQIHTTYRLSADRTISTISESLYKRSKKAVYGDVVLATTSEDVEGVAKPVVWLGKDPIAVSGDAHIFHHGQNGKYIAHIFMSSSFAKFKSMCATGAKVVRISGDNMAKFNFPIPSLEEQSRIVSILDTFEASISNLEAQLEQRQKQYEYYRNKLLTFE